LKSHDTYFQQPSNKDTLLCQLQLSLQGFVLPLGQIVTSVIPI